MSELQQSSGSNKPSLETQSGSETYELEFIRL
jgi:hypothetical protein